MSTALTPPAGPGRRGRVIALHCSGAGAGQWRQLAEAFGPDYELLAPEHYGCDSTGHWRDGERFTLADEAARTIDLIDATEDKVHLVGHSYGGGVALHVSLARPHRIASVTLYEPSAFHLLRAMGEQGAAAFAEIAAIADGAKEAVAGGRPADATRSFIDYWSGDGAWDALRPCVQAALMRWVPKAPLDFQALMEEPAPPAAYARLLMPVLIIRGEDAPRPTRLIAELLAALLPAARLTAIEGAGHMGPLTHAAVVNEAIVAHVVAAQAAIHTPCPVSCGGAAGRHALALQSGVRLKYSYADAESARTMQPQS